MISAKEPFTGGLEGAGGVFLGAGALLFAEGFEDLIAGTGRLGSFVFAGFPGAALDGACDADF